MTEQATEKTTYRRWADVPARLKTKTQLNEMGLRPSRGQEPTAFFDSPNGDWKLYDLSLAIPKRKMSEAQEATLAKAREKAERLRSCGSLYHCFQALSLEEYGERKAGRIRAALRERGEDISKAEYQYICRFCRDRQWAAEWAREVLADPGAIILDTETTGFDETAEIIEIAIINIRGETLFESLVKPRGVMAETHIHGITAEDVVSAPTWPEILFEVWELCRNASRVIVYNAEYDRRIIQQTGAAWQLSFLAWELPPADYGKAEPPIAWNCAMEQYARWYGNWSDYHKSYRWQRLEGGHRALGDCLACLEYIKRMAKDEG
jgi:hypothetical protein